MKRIIFIASLSIIAFVACNNKATDNSSDVTTYNDTTTNSQVSVSNNNAATSGTPVKVILSGYLHLKNALASDNGNDAAAAGSEILAAINSLDTSKFNEAQKKAFADVADDTKENAEHISTNAGKIDHQREHFEMLSKDVYDLVKVFGAGQKVYKDFCPMAFNQKGAFWLSEIKDIKNPYLGKEMPDCGEVKEELK